MSSHHRDGHIRPALPPGLTQLPESTEDLLLRLHYVGDVARIMIGDTVINDDFYNGNPLEIGLRRHAAALKTVEIMRLVAPGEYRLLLDAGVLYARTQQTQAAIDVLEDYIKQAPYDRDRHEAALLLRQLKESMN